MSIEVTRAYTSHYPDPIVLEADAVVQVEREDAEYPGWYWCRASTGKEGWVHRSFLAGCDGMTTCVRAYSAGELTAAVGDRGTLLHFLDGWAYVRLESGEEGWIPQSHVHSPGT